MPIDLDVIGEFPIKTIRKYLEFSLTISRGRISTLSNSSTRYGYINVSDFDNALAYWDNIHAQLNELCLTLDEVLEPNNG